MSVRLALLTVCLLTFAVGARAQEAGKVFKDCETCPEMMLIPGGKFVMGVPRGEEERHGVPESNRGRSEPMTEMTIEPFLIGRFEITRGQFAAFVAETNYVLPLDRGCWEYYGIPADPNTPRRAIGRPELDASLNWKSPGYEQDDRHPVVCLSWVDIRAYLGWLSKKAGVTYRLPSEAEWEFTARAGTDTARPWGDDAESACKYGNVSDLSRVAAHRMIPTPDNLFQCNDGFPATAPVGSFPPNPFGVYDLIGNVWEVTEDCFEPNLEKLSKDGRARINDPLADQTDACEERVSRGGSFDLFPWFIRVGYRSRFQLYYEAYGYIRLSMEGFRVARSLK